jgi:hypothetical protein
MNQRILEHEINNSHEPTRNLQNSFNYSELPMYKNITDPEASIDCLHVLVSIRFLLAFNCHCVISEREELVNKNERKRKQF